MSPTDQYWMRYALALAEKAEQQGEVPIGAVVVYEQHCIAEGWNQPISQHDPTAHAEIIALRAAAKRLENYRLPNTVLYVTLEPCVMCAGAIIQARVRRIVFGAYDPKAGAVSSRFDILRDTRHTHRVDCQGGVLAEVCGEMLKQFFINRR